MPHFSALTWRILAFNALALIVLTGGVVLVQASGRGLVEERLNGVQQQAAIVAGSLAAYAANPDSPTINIAEAEPLLSQMISPSRLRARFYLPTGRLAMDTRFRLSRNVVTVSQLPGLDTASQIREWFNRLYDGIMGVRPFARLEPYYEAGEDGRVYREVQTALSGTTASAERVDDQNRLVLSVAVPVQGVRTVYGALLVSTEGGDIDDILRQERTTLFEVVLVAFLVMLFSSAGLFRGLTRERCAAYPGSMYGFFEIEFGVRMVRAEERLHAVAASGAAASLLRVAPGTPLLAVDRVAYTYGERPVELRRGLCATRNEHYWNALS